jgi:hypothetical protein
MDTALPRELRIGLYFNIIDFPCNPMSFVLCVVRHYSKKGSITFTTLGRNGIGKRKKKVENLFFKSTILKR